MLLILLTTITGNSVCAKKLFVEMEFSDNCIKINDGTKKGSQTLKDIDGKDIEFSTLIGALNYMSLQGWELAEIKSIISGSGHSVAGGLGSSSTETKFYYIFTKDVSDEELKEVVDKSYKNKKKQTKQ